MQREINLKKFAALVDHNDSQIQDFPMNSGDLKELLKLSGNPKGVLKLLSEEGSNEVFCVWLMYKDIGKSFAGKKYEPLVQPQAAYRIAEVPNRGLGMIATRSIKAGETIMWERPLVLAPMATDWSPWEVAAMEKHMVSKLSKRSQDKFFELSNSQSDEDEFGGTVHQIIGTNAFGVFIPQSKHLHYYSGVFPVMSRCNHDCSSNAITSFDINLFAKELRAVRNINPGEEITVTYISVLCGTEERQTMLQNSFHFTCNCKACKRDGVERSLSDQRRRYIACGTMNHFHEFLSTRDTTGKMAIETYSSILSQIKEENVQNYSYAFTRGLTHIYASLGDEVNTLKWAKKARKACRISLDSTSTFRDPSICIWDEFLKDVKRHPYWNVAISEQSQA